MKLIVCDLDGTLKSHTEKTLNKNVFSAIEYVLDQKCVFAVASGRNYAELKEFFAPLSRDIYYITNDGAELIYKEETLYEKPIEESFSSDSYALHGKYVTYFFTKDTLLLRKAMAHYKNHVMVIDKGETPPSPYYKITDYTKKDFDALPLVYEDNSMKEYIAKGVNKGVAIKELMKILGVTKEDTISFGDNTNDLEMFRETTSYAVASAKPSVKKQAKNVCQSFETEIRKLI